MKTQRPKMTWRSQVICGSISFSIYTIHFHLSISNQKLLNLLDKSGIRMMISLKISLSCNKNMKRLFYILKLRFLSINILKILVNEHKIKYIRIFSIRERKKGEKKIQALFLSFLRTIINKIYKIDQHE